MPAARGLSRNGGDGFSGRRICFFPGRYAERHIQRAEPNEARQDENDRNDSKDDGQRPMDLFREEENRDDGGQNEPKDAINRSHVDFHCSLLSGGKNADIVPLNNTRGRKRQEPDEEYWGRIT